MKVISPALQQHLDGELTMLAECIKITRTDGVVIAFTTHDCDLVLDGLTYKADGSFTSGRLDNSASFNQNKFEIKGMLDSIQLDGESIKAGLYDYARVDVFIVNWADTEQGKVQIRRGWLGEVTLTDGRYTAALHGMHDLLRQRVGDAYTPECRHDLGDGMCCINLASMEVSGVVTDSFGKTAFSDYMRIEPNGYFDYGKLVWTSGANKGLSVDVHTWDGLNLTMSLWLPMPNAISLGDSYTVCPGCDKRFSTCKTKFGNEINYGGFPHLPGVGKILQYPDAK